MGTRSKTSEIALFGNVAIGRAYCRECQTNAFIIDGKLACCDAPYEKTPKKFHRASGSVQRRKLPPLAKRKKMLEEQDNRCFYCGVEFHTMRWRKSKAIRIRLNWDHMLPYAYSQNNNASNFVAACHVCNGIKSDKVFSTVDEAKTYLEDRRKAKGYDF